MKDFFVESYYVFLYILKGAHIAIIYSFASMIFGLCLALLMILIARIKKNFIVKLLITFYISVFRGTPMLLQLTIFYFGISAISKITISAALAAIITLSLNSSAYLYEIIRAAVLSIPKGQVEAAKVLGVKEIQILKDIILPQALKNIFPALTNELITLLKDTSLVSIVGMHDMMFRSKIIASEKFTWFFPFLISGVIYYMLVLIISYFSKKIEKKIHQ